MSVDPEKLGCNCAACPFSKDGRAVRPIGATLNAKAVGTIVVDYPLGDDVGTGSLLSGATGNEFRRSCSEVGLDFSKLNRASALLCRPTLGANENEIKRAVKACKPALKVQLGAADALPKFIAGQQACDAVFPKRVGARNGRGFVRPEGIVAVAPSYAFFGNAREWAGFLIDLERFKRLLVGRLENMDFRVNTAPTVDDIWALIAKSEGVVALDIETAPITPDEPWTGKDPTQAQLKSIALGTAAGDSVALWWDDIDMQRADALREVCADAGIVKVMHNGFWFDERVLKRYGFAFNNVEDTRDLRRAISANSRLSLAYVISLYGDFPAWKESEEDEGTDEQK